MNYCFCTLALGQKYRILAKELAKDLEKYAPKALMIVYTERPNDFQEYHNISAYKYHQKGIPHCFNDRRFVVEKALSMYSSVIHIDADTRILAAIPEQLNFKPGITAEHEHLLQHAKKWMLAPNLKILKNVAMKLNIPLEKASITFESLYIITRDEGKELEFLKQWDFLTKTLELAGYTGTDGYLMGIAAQEVGWNINEYGWNTLKNVTNHFYASSVRQKSKNLFNRLQKRIKYYYRLTVSRLVAMTIKDNY